MTRRKDNMIFAEYKSLPGFGPEEVSKVIILTRDESENETRREMIEKAMQYAYVLGFRAGQK